MPKIITFAGLSFTPANGIIAADITGDLGAAKRNVTTVQSAGGRGITVLRTQLQGKQIDIEGVVLLNSEDDFKSAIRLITQVTLAEGLGPVPTGDLQIQNSEGTFIYEDCLLLNPDSMFAKQEPHHITWIPFKLSFLCPKGFATNVIPETVTVSGITSLPYTDMVMIDGTADPEPALEYTFNTASGITGLTFTNQTTNEAITVSGLTLANGDTIIIDTKNKQVFQNTTLKTWAGVMPSFKAGINNYQITVSGASNLDQSNVLYNSERDVYGTNYLAQKFIPSGSISVAQLALALKQKATNVFTLYDDFSSGTISGSLWTTSGRVVPEPGGRAHIGAPAGGSSTDASIVSTAVNAQGWQWWWSVGAVGSPSATRPISEVTTSDRSKRITYAMNGDGTMTITTAGYDGSSATMPCNNDMTLAVKQNGSNIDIYQNGLVVMTITGYTLDANSRVAFRTYAEPGGGASNEYAIFGSIYQLQNSTANGDITVEIRTDSSGHPSGTVVTHGSVTIPINTVSPDTFGEIIASFSTMPSLTAATTYHLVIHQSGGDINNYLQVGNQTTDVYGSGNTETSPDSGTNWTQRASEDLYFKIWSTAPSGFNIDQAITYYPSQLTVV